MKVDNKKPTCPICGGSVLAVKGAVYDTDTCRKKAKRERYKVNRESKGLSRNGRTAKYLVEAEEYKRAKFGEGYREQST